MVTKKIKPVLLERLCDWGREEMGPEAWRQMVDEFRTSGGSYPGGCEVKFQWYFGDRCECPLCGRMYSFTMEQFNSGKYFADPKIKQKLEQTKEQCRRAYIVRARCFGFKVDA